MHEDLQMCACISNMDEQRVAFKKKAFTTDC